LWYFNDLGEFENFVAESLGAGQRFRNNALEVNEQKADHRFQGMGHIRRARKLAKHGGDV